MKNFKTFTEDEDRDRKNGYERGYGPEVIKALRNTHHVKHFEYAPKAGDADFHQRNAIVKGAEHFDTLRKANHIEPAFNGHHGIEMGEPEDHYVVRLTPSAHQNFLRMKS
jgi:hypothetical protein